MRGEPVYFGSPLSYTQGQGGGQSESEVGARMILCAPALAKAARGTRQSLPVSLHE